MKERGVAVSTGYVYRSPPVAEFAPFIEQALLEDRRQSALRLFIQINDNLQACAPEQKIEMATDEPPLTGHPGYDALLAYLPRNVLHIAMFSSERVS